MVEAKYIIASRNMNGETHTEVSGDLLDAMAKQMGMLVGASGETMVKMVESDLEIVKKDLSINGKHRICNDEEEVYIFLLPEKERMR